MKKMFCLMLLVCSTVSADSISNIGVVPPVVDMTTTNAVAPDLGPDWMYLTWESNVAINSNVLNQPYGYEMLFDEPQDLSVSVFSPADWNLLRFESDGTISSNSPDITIVNNIASSTAAIRDANGFAVPVDDIISVIGATYLKWTVTDYVALAGYQQEVATKVQNNPVPVPATLTLCGLGIMGIFGVLLMTRK